MSDSLWPHGLQHARLLCHALPLRLCSNSGSLSRWCYLTISSSAFNLPQDQGLLQWHQTPLLRVQRRWAKPRGWKQGLTAYNWLLSQCLMPCQKQTLSVREVEGGWVLRYAKVENAPTIPASSLGKGQLLGKRKAASLPGYILAQTNNVLLEATNLYKQTNPEEEEGEALHESNPGTGFLPHPALSLTPPSLPPLFRKAFYSWF